MAVARALTLAVAAAVALAGCAEPEPSASVEAPSVPVPSPTPSSVVSTTTTSTTTEVAPAWPREGWTQQTEYFGTLTVYFPDTWSFDSDFGYWGDGVIKTFCEAWIDPTLTQPGAPDAHTIATTQWDFTFGPGAAANEHPITTFFGATGWAADVTLGDGVTVEPRVYLILGDVWIHCGAITRGTGRDGAELWDIVDSIAIANKAGLAQGSWMDPH